MEENPDPTAAIDRLRRQHAHKRGLVTKLLKKIQFLDTCHPDDLDLVVIDGLSDELSSTVSAHNQIQAQINDLVLDSEEAYESELVESERHDEIHTDLRRTLRRVRERYQLWSDSNSIVGEIKLLLAATDTTSPRFEARFQSFISRCTPFLNSGKCHRLVPAFRDRFTAFEEARDILFRHEGTPLPTPASASPFLLLPALRDTMHCALRCHPSMETLSTGSSLRACLSLPSRLEPKATVPWRFADCSEVL